jgi:hypothetical protein
MVKFEKNGEEKMGRGAYIDPLVVVVILLRSVEKLWDGLG